ncbi:MAG: tRNA (adenosine(37)-N6)-dimethylallyltransferase MiaA [Pseudomonadota bacterium]|nr:tRNA (adenosine(37)-N6)-dimethylallyltransferase MiaA [Pseudomonadota bacterium]MEC8752892.1 tRNA (adenosine(37)-N6)-dimethylallyltransferase MiaA [Pseudomonadota bacterium]MEE3008242.1 tRNA (adenosine(37)-N6)-dimethylallyltransferase MiaA [Pseudomonadota bacterium]
MKAVIICGPTGAGKSSLALNLAEKFEGVIINADSVQIYREIKILSGRPTSDDYRKAPHRLYGIMSIFKPCTLGIWRKMALETIKECELSGRLPIICGGTGLYIKFLLNELSAIPEISPSIKLEAREKLKELGNENFRELLSKNDPASASRIKSGDTNRLLRAWEVFTATTKPLSYWHKKSRKAGSQHKFFKVCLMPERKALYSICDQRFLEFVEQGAVEEARAFDFITASPELPASKTLGLLELIKYTKGELELSDAVEQAQRATRRYAKRQLTWFRHQLDEDFLIQNLSCSKTVSDCFKKIVNFLG